MTGWFISHYIEIIGVVLSLVYLFLSIKQNIWLWPVGLISSILFVIVFFQSKFYADMGLNGYYFFISIYGWITWANKKNSNKPILQVSRAGLKMIIIVLLSIALLFFLLGYLLKNYTDSPIPYWDSLTTAGSIVATWMLAKKIIEHWIIWVVVDLIAFGLYIYRGLYPTAVLFAVYTAMAIVGYVQWNRTFKKANLV